MPVPVVVIENFAGKTGFDKLITDLTTGNNSVQEGIRFTVSQLSVIDPATVAKLDHTFPNPCNRCRFDVQLTSGKYLEFKSVADEGGVTRDQFRTYVSNINDFEQLDYVFDAGKTSLIEAKNFMQTAMRSESYKVFDNMSDNLKESLGIDTINLTNAEQKASFIQMVDNLSPALFEFVKVRP